MLSNGVSKTLEIDLSNKLLRSGTWKENQRQIPLHDFKDQTYYKPILPILLGLVYEE